MADLYYQDDDDRDSTFGEGDSFLDPLMYPPPSAPSLAGHKRSLTTHHNDEYPAEHVDPRALCCTNTCPGYSVTGSSRPAKKSKVSQFQDVHGQTSTTTTPCEPCFAEFCNECDLPTVCTDPCPLPCPVVECSKDECSKDDVCRDPDCDQVPCFTGCADPACTKAACPTDPCFCQNCDAPPCPLDSGTIYCYDNGPCHFQDGVHSYNPNPLHHGMYDGSHCFSPDGSLIPCTFPSQAPNHGYVPIGSVSSHSTPFNGYAPCPTDQTCCPEPPLPCQQCPPSHNHYDSWNFPLPQNNGFSNPVPASPAGFGAQQGDHSWYFDSSHVPNAPIAPNLSLLHQAAQLEFPYLPSKEPVSSETDSGLGSRRPSTQATTPESQSHACKWLINSVPCSASFPTAEALHKHIKTAHVDNCAQCICQWENCSTHGKDFKQRSKLSRHLLLHAGHRPYACSFPLCTKTFATNQAKDNHERTHTGEKPYLCSTCGYTTTTHTQLQTHISALHTHEKPHKCRYCAFTCADSSNLSKHERTHQTLRPYRCSHPGCSFRPDCRWENLKRHFKRSGHCPELLVEGSEEGKRFREGVKREVEEWARTHGNGNVVGSGKEEEKGG